MFDVVTIGAATVDIFVKSPQFAVNRDRHFVTGKSLSLAYSSKNEISQSLVASGGGATNSAVTFARLGLHTACIARAGQDNFYQVIKQELQQDKITNLVSTPAKDLTDFSVILVADDGARSILTNRGDTGLTEADIDWDKIAQAKWLYITSLEGNVNLLEKLIGFAHEEGIKISLNPGNRELAKRRILLPLLKYVDFLLLNTVESQLLLNREFNKHDFLQDLIQLGPKIAAVTNGRDGAYVVTPEDTYYSPIINVTPVDETGAGDAFGSAFVSALIYGNDPKTALRWAINNSASVVSHLGAKPGILTLDQIK